MPIRTVEYPGLPNCFITANLDRQNNFTDNNTYQAFYVGPDKFEGYQFISQNGSFSGNLNEFEFSGIYKFRYDLDDYTFHGEMCGIDMKTGVLYNKGATNKFKFFECELSTIYLHKLGPKKYKMKIKELSPDINFYVFKNDYICSVINNFDCPDFDLALFLVELRSYEIETEFVNISKYNYDGCALYGISGPNFASSGDELTDIQNLLKMCELPERHKPSFFAILSPKSPFSRAITTGPTTVLYRYRRL